MIMKIGEAIGLNLSLSEGGPELSHAAAAVPQHPEGPLHVRPATPLPVAQEPLPPGESDTNGRLMFRSLVNC